MVYNDSHIGKNLKLWEEQFLSQKKQKFLPIDKLLEKLKLISNDFVGELNTEKTKKLISNLLLGLEADQSENENMTSSDILEYHFEDGIKKKTYRIKKIFYQI